MLSSNSKTLFVVILVFYSCFFNTVLKAQENSDKYPGLIGWDGDINAVSTKLSGALYIRTPSKTEAGVHIYNNPTSGLKWFNEEGFLPCLVTEWQRNGCTVRIKHLVDKVDINAGYFYAVFTRVEITNNSSEPVVLDPSPYGGLIAMTSEGFQVEAGKTVKHDFYIAYEKADNVSWGESTSIPSKGTWDDHYNHMKSYWNDKLSSIIQFNQLPDYRLANAFKAGYIYIQIIKDYVNGVPKMNVGENAYDDLYNHDLIGIAATLLTVGDNSEIKEIMETFFDSNYPDGTYKYPWPFALYLLKTNDLDYVKSKFNSIKDKAHVIASSRTGPGKIMKESWGIDATGYWMVDNYSALMGLWSYKIICDRTDNAAEATWAQTEYNSLLTSVNTSLETTIKNNNITYIPASATVSNDANRCHEPKDSNWASMFHFGRWPWEGYLMNAPQSGVAVDLIDSTFAWGLNRGQKAGLPPHTFGGFPNYSSGYNVAYGIVGLRGNGKYRSESIYGFQFLLNNGLSSPNATFENVNYPAASPWEGVHPGFINEFRGSCPHAWSISFNMKALADAILAEKVDGKVIVGRGIPDEWIRTGQIIEVSNYPILNNKRMGVIIERTDTAFVTLTMTGDVPSGSVIFNLPIFLNNNIDHASAGTINVGEGTVEFSNTVRSMKVYLRNKPVTITAIDKQEVTTGCNISVSPNPLSGNSATVHIKGFNHHASVAISLMDLNGRVLLNKILGTDADGNCNYELQKDTFQGSGLYLIKVQDSKTSKHAKIIVR